MVENFKLEHFRKPNPEKALPNRERLSEKECLQIQQKLAIRLGVHEGQLFKEISVRSVSLEGLNAEGNAFVFKTAGIALGNHLFVNWYRFDNIDRISTFEFIRYFDDLWYPSSDDIEIFDETMDWIMSVRHDGTIWVLKLTTDN